MGIIKDEGVVELNWNKKKTDVLGFFLRQYLKISICQTKKEILPELRLFYLHKKDNTF